MKNINWKVRLQHKPFLVALFAAVLFLVQQVAAIFGVDTTIYNEQATDVFNALLAVLALVGIVIDPTTQGASDSSRALDYEQPKGDK